jgi:hypothetical protein
MYRTEITNFIWKSDILRATYILGVKRRRINARHTAVLSDDDCKLINGNLYRQCSNFKPIYTKFDLKLTETMVKWNDAQTDFYDIFSEQGNEVSADNAMDVEDLLQRKSIFASPPNAHDTDHGTQQCGTPRQKSHSTDTLGTVIQPYTDERNNTAQTVTVAGNKRNADAMLNNDRLIEISNYCQSSSPQLRILHSTALSGCRVLDDGDVENVVMHDPPFKMAISCPPGERPEFLSKYNFFSYESTLPEFERDQLPRHFNGDNEFITILDSKKHNWIKEVGLFGIGASNVVCKYRLFNKANVKGCRNTYELQLEITELEPKGCITKECKIHSMVLLQSSPLLTNGVAPEDIVIIQSLKVRTYREAVLMLFAIIRIYSSPDKERILQLEYMKNSPYIWDKVEAAIMKTLKFKCRTGNYTITIPMCKKVMELSNSIVPSQHPFNKYAKGGTLRNYDDFLKKNNEYTTYSETEYEEAFKEALKFTMKNDAQSLMEENEDYRNEQWARNISQDSVDPEYVNQRYRPDIEDSQEEVGSEDATGDKNESSEEKLGGSPEAPSPIHSPPNKRKRHGKTESLPDPPEGASPEEIVARAIIFYHDTGDYEKVAINLIINIMFCY